MLDTKELREAYPIGDLHGHIYGMACNLHVACDEVDALRALVEEARDHDRSGWAICPWCRGMKHAHDCPAATRMGWPRREA